MALVFCQDSLQLFVESFHCLYLRVLLEEQLAKLRSLLIALKLNQLNLLSIKPRNLLPIPLKIIKPTVIPSINLPILIPFLPSMRILKAPNLAYGEFFLKFLLDL